MKTLFRILVLVVAVVLMAAAIVQVIVSYYDAFTEALIKVPEFWVTVLLILVLLGMFMIMGGIILWLVVWIIKGVDKDRSWE